MSGVIYKGDTSVHFAKTNGSVQYERGFRRVFVEEGKYADLEGRMLYRGDTKENRYVLSSSLERLPGGMGRLTTVTGSKPSRHATDESSKKITIYEVESAQLEKPLLEHDAFKDVIGEVSRWMTESDPAIRAAFRYREDEDDEEGIALTGKALEAAGLIAAGAQSYLAFTPVIRVTTRYIDGGTPNNVGKDNGKIDTPPSDALSLVSGSWKWLKTADRCLVDTSSSIAERIEEWTAAKEWSRTLYS